jgi:class 3 adenylate cyclase
MFVDISDSTHMSLSLPQDKFALVIQTFIQEIGIIVLGYGGYLFKYDGDAVIILFNANFDETKACENALNCSTAILRILRDVINPIFRTNDLPEIRVRIGMAYGHILVVLYGKNLEIAHIDIIGSSISLAAKIKSIAGANQVLIGEYIYNILLHSNNHEYFKNSKFTEVTLDPSRWKYLSHFDSQSMYRVYQYVEPWWGA